MRTQTLNLYSFDELSATAQEYALKKYADFYNCSDWWDFILLDAKLVGVDIKTFDLYPSHIKLDFIDNSYTTAFDITNTYGEGSDMYKVSKDYLEAFANLVKHYSDGELTNIVAEGNEDAFDDDAKDLEKDYLKDLGSMYLHSLQQEYDYICSSEYLIEMFECNGVEFTEDGRMF